MAADEPPKLQMTPDVNYIMMGSLIASCGREHARVNKSRHNMIFIYINYKQRMENYVTICFNISTHEYESLIAHFNGYGIEKEGEDTIDYSLSELVQGKVKNEDKKNPLFISAVMTLCDYENFSIQQSSHAIVDRQFLEIMKANEIFGRRAYRNEMSLNVEKYSWKDLYYFQFMQMSPESILCVMKDLNASTFFEVSKKEMSRKKDMRKMIRSLFEDVLRLLSFERVDQVLEKFFVEMDDGMRQDSFILNKTVNYWMLENNYVLNYVTASMSKMQEQS